MLLRIVTIEKTQKRKLMGRKISQRFATVKEKYGRNSYGNKKFLKLNYGMRKA